jgi:hypothetical protein
MAERRAQKKTIDQEIEKLSKDNAAIAYANYMGTLCTLRADVVQQMESLDLSPSKVGWACYDLDDQDRPAPHPRTLLLICGQGEQRTGEGKTFTRPSLRFFQSELFQTPLGYEFLTTDVSVDYDGDAQYLIDTLWLPQTKPKEFMASTEAEEKSLRAVETSEPYVPFFRAEQDGSLLLAGEFAAFTPPLELTQEVAGGRVIKSVPFGRYDVPADASDALDVAVSLFNQVRDSQPGNFGELR